MLTMNSTVRRDKEGHFVNSLRPNEGTAGKLRIFFCAVFGIYLALLLYYLLFWNGFGRMDLESFRYNVRPFQEISRFWTYRVDIGREETFLNLAGNIAGFVPLGFLIPVLFRNMRSFPRIILCGALLSLTVELIQLLTGVGIFDVDDLILNTAGTAIGALVARFCSRLWRKKHG